MIAATAAAVMPAACGSGKPAPLPRAEADAGRPAIFATSAVRCAECHSHIYDEWRFSAHGRSRTAPLYRAMSAAAASHDCESCHAPLAGVLGDDEIDPVVSEGVTCDVCHTIRAVDPRPRGAGFRMALDDNRKYGPICEGEAPYFHKLGCSPLHQESSFCAACHMLHLSSPAGDVPVFTEYEEWLISPQADQGIDCQRCHMPPVFTEAATGAGTRAGVSHHGMRGVNAALPARVVDGRLDLAVDKDVIEVTATLTNQGAAHAVPSGLPGRRLELRLWVEDERGRETSSWRRAFTRTLVDDAGREVPFFKARRQLDDTRLQARQSRSETARLAAPAAGTLRAYLVLTLSPEIVAQVGAEPPAETVLMRIALDFSPKKPLPRTVQLP